MVSRLTVARRKRAATEKGGVAAKVHQVHRSRKERQAGKVVDEAEILHRVHDVGCAAHHEKKWVDKRREHTTTGARLVDTGREPASDQEADYVDHCLNDDLRLDGTGKPEVGKAERNGHPAQEAAAVREIHGKHHEHAALKGHTLQAALVEGSVDVGAGDPEIAPGELDRRKDVHREQEKAFPLWHISFVNSVVVLRTP